MRKESTQARRQADHLEETAEVVVIVAPAAAAREGRLGNPVI